MVSSCKIRYNICVHVHVSVHLCVNQKLSIIMCLLFLFLCYVGIL